MNRRLDVVTYDLQELISPLTLIDDINEIYLFGSRAYNTGSLRSDIDLLVYAPKGVRADEIQPIIQENNILDVFETVDKNCARSFANDSRLFRKNIVATLDAILLWNRNIGYIEENINNNKKQNGLRNYDYKMSYMPIYTEAENQFYNEFGYNSIFVIMPFDDEYYDIYKSIENFFAAKNMKVVRADAKTFSDDLWGNIEVYLKCCNIAIGVFTQQDKESFNPNVALEVGYMMARGMNICLLKDDRLSKLPSDIIGKLYNEYNHADIQTSITELLQKWCENKHIL